MNCRGNTPTPSHLRCTTRACRRASGTMPELLPLKRRQPFLTHPTCDRLEAIGLTDMAQALHEQRRPCPQGDRTH
jgi:hypothetical protein